MQKFSMVYVFIGVLVLNGCASTARPQTPVPPFPYTEQMVRVTNQEDAVSLDGVLTLPSGAGGFPVVILISGSGPSNYDQEWGGHKPFWVIADYLTRNGIAVLRLNDRDMDKPVLEFYQNTTADFASDIAAAVEYVRSLPETRSAPLGLIGHSEGGIVAAMVAAAGAPVDFLILLGTPGLPLNQVTGLAAKQAYQRAGTPEEEIQRLMGFHEDYDAIVTNYSSEGQARSRAEALYDRYFKGSSLYSHGDRHTLTTKVSLPWYRFMMTNDPAVYLRQISQPVLAITGEYDSQVTPEENLSAIDEALMFAGSKKNRVVMMEHLNHMLQPTEGYTEYGDISETVSLSLLQEIYDWIQTSVRWE